MHLTPTYMVFSLSVILGGEAVSSRGEAWLDLRGGVGGVVRRGGVLSPKTYIIKEQKEKRNKL